MENERDLAIKGITSVITIVSVVVKWFIILHFVVKFW